MANDKQMWPLGVFNDGTPYLTARGLAKTGRNLHTIIITAREKDGSIETREAEPYSYRITAGTEKLFCYDMQKQGTRNFLVSNIISVEETQHSFNPQWDVEV